MSQRPYRLSARKAAQKQLANLPFEEMLRISEAISGLADDPRPEGNEKLEGTDDGFRIRVGDYRVVYRVNDKDRQVKVTDVVPRKDAYRKF